MTLDAVLTELAPRVLRYCVGYTGDPALGQDLAQESLAALVRTWQQGRPPDHAEAFVFTVARRAARRAMFRRAPVMGITLEPGRSGVARGRVVVDGSARPGALKALRVTAEAPDEHAVEIDVPPVAVAPDGSFEMRGLFGRQLPSVEGANDVNLDVKSVRVDGEDVTDTGVVFAPGQVRDHIEIVLTSVRTALKGIVQDDRQRPASATVMLFSEDPSKWTSPTDAYVRRTKADAKGAFRLAGIRPGDYLILAVDDFDMATYGDPTVLERLRALGTRVEIAAGTEATATLALQRP